MPGTIEKSCGCKGIRSCLVCEPQPHESDAKISVPQIVEQYIFCLICEKAWKEEVADVCRHPDHPGEGIPFPGILVIPEYVTLEEEKRLISEIDKTAWTLSQSGRKKQDYGPKVNFKRKKLKAGPFTGLPPFSQFLVDRLTTHPTLEDFKPVELCNLEYVPERGSSIDPHFDDFWVWGDRLVTLNLLSETTLSMTQEESPTVEVRIGLPPRSLLVVYGPARTQWKHGIHREDVRARRLAVTLRELTPEFLEGGPQEEVGRELLDVALSFQGVAIGTS